MITVKDGNIAAFYTFSTHFPFAHNLLDSGENDYVQYCLTVVKTRFAEDVEDEQI